ncbi:MAG: helicase HerA-like domain-containing protein [Chitinophagales bacterium]
MANQEQFVQTIQQGYTFSGGSILVGGAMLDAKSVPNTPIKIPLKTLNRHGLIAGATGTGKTKTIQTLSEKLSENGVSVLMMDIKGDFSGVAEPGVLNQKITDRVTAIGNTWNPKGYPVELMSISTQDGVRLRATVTEFGPVLISKILDLNDTQEGVVAMVFKFCDDQNLALVDLPDFKKVLQFLTNEGKDIFEKEYGAVSPATVGTILRKVVELEQQGADLFFGETSFNVNDLLRKDENGYGYINIVRLTDIQDKPKLFSTFMLSLLAEVYAKFPERGDVDQPELIIFLDEAHLIFDNATKALKDQLESIIKLIRSKGVGIFFCTQNPNDIPESILAQLGLKVQHALRAFTAKDRQAIKLVAENYPITDFYKVEDLITQLGIGEAFVTALNEKGIPTPLVHALMTPPQSRMDILNESEMQTLIRASKLYNKYKETVDPESAFEILSAKMEQLQQQEAEAAQAKEEAKQAKTTTRSGKAEKSTLDKVLSNTVTRQIARTATTTLTRGLLGALKGMFK